MTVGEAAGVGAVLLEVLATLARAFGIALRASDDAARLEAARGALLDSVAVVEGELARKKFPELRGP